MSSAAFPPGSAGAPTVADGRAFLRAVLEDRTGARRPSGERCLVILPGPSAAPHLLGPGDRPPAVLFASNPGVVLVGWGAADTIARDGHDLERVRVDAERAHRETVTLAHPGVPPQGGRRQAAWIGGHSFVPGSGTDTAWSVFPDLCFVLPRWSYRDQDGVATVALALTPGDHVDVAERIAEYTSLLTGGVPAQGPAPAAYAPLAPRPSALAEDRPGWLAGTRSALDAIARGDLRKVVLARHLDLPLEPLEPIDLPAMLDELARRFPTCTRFLFSRAGVDFFGATPETLVERRGTWVRAEAMAGSCRRGDEAALATSSKDAREHALVVEEIVARLVPFCELVTPPPPTIRRFANVAHLWTPLRGTLAGPVHVLELVGALHPTPAVAGTPTDAAVALVSRTETVTRGWFAAPFGWFDATGDGHFVVALRSCVRHAGGLRLYAGAGIVSGSDPEREFDETVLKMRAVLDTLHGIPEEPASRVG